MWTGRCIHGGFHQRLRPKVWCEVLLYCRRMRRLGLHVTHQLELGAAAVQVVALAVHGEIMVTVQIVGEEADAALHGHGLSAHGHHFQFLVGESGAGGEEALGEDAEHIQAHLHLAQVLLILGGGSGAEAD